MKFIKKKDARSEFITNNNNNNNLMMMTMIRGKRTNDLNESLYEQYGIINNSGISCN